MKYESRQELARTCPVSDNTTQKKGNLQKVISPCLHLMHARLRMTTLLNNFEDQPDVHAQHAP